MKPIHFLPLLLLLATLPAAASSDDTLARTSAIQFSFCPYVGTHGAFEREYINYLSVNLTVGISGGERGLAVAGLSNVVHGDATGVQIAGISNHAHDGGIGLAMAGVVNTAQGGYRGVQIAGAANHAGDVQGMQLAGLYNVAGRVRGVQIGIVNVAESSDWTLGLVNIVRDGLMILGLQYDAAGSAMLAFRSGGRHLYGILGAGYNHRTGGATTEAGGCVKTHKKVL